MEMLIGFFLFGSWHPCKRVVKKNLNDYLVNNSGPKKCHCKYFIFIIKLMLVLSLEFYHKVDVSIEFRILLVRGYLKFLQLT
jgi:hypothetical protein